MVYSTELGYDPEEWEECPEPEHFLAFGLFTRIWLSILTVVLSLLFFWMLESKKHSNKPSVDSTGETANKQVDDYKTREKEVLRKNISNDPFNPLANSWPQIVEETHRSRAASGNTTPKARRGSKKPLTADELEAMQVWERQLNEVAERRLRESQEHDSEDLRQLEGQQLQEVERDSTFGLCNTAFDNQSLLSEFTGGNAATLLRDIQRLRVSECATPPSTPPEGAPSLEAHYRQMADDLKEKLLREIRAGSSFKIDTPPNSVSVDVQRALTEQFQQRYEEDINRAVEQLQKEHADELGSSNSGQELRRKLESQIEGVVRQHSHSLTRHDNLERDVLRPKKSNDEEIGDRSRTADETMTNRIINLGVSVQSEPGHLDKVQADHHRSVRNGEPTDKPSVGFYVEEETAQQFHKGSSSSDEGFVKVDREYADTTAITTDPRPPLPVSKLTSGQQLEEPELLIAPSPTPEEWGSDSGGVSNSPGPRISIEIDDTVTADDIEFLLQGQASPASHASPYVEMLDIDANNDSQEEVYPPQVVIIPDSLDNQYLKSMEKRQEEYQEHSQPSALDAREEEQVMKLLQEYELGNLASQNRVEETAGQAQESFSGFDIVHMEQKKKPEFEQERMRTLKNQRLMSFKSDDKSPYEEVEIKKKNEKSDKEGVSSQRAPVTPVLNTQLPVFEIEETYSEQRQKVDEFEKKEQVFVSDGALDEDPQRLVQAEIFLQDAMDFMESQQPRALSATGGFVMEEEMLESDKQPVPASAKALANEKLGQSSEKDLQNASADPTSRLIKTNEVFEKPEPVFDDADDAVTYAPEIQSLEIPPDQISENSLNLVENFSEHHELQAPPAEAAVDGNKKTDEIPQKTVESNQFGKQEGLPAVLQKAASPGMGSSSKERSSAAAPKAPQFLRKRKNGNGFDDISTSSISSSSRSMHKQSSLLSALGVTSTQEMLLKLPSLDALSDAMRRAGLESTNLIFGIDYTASNKYQGEHSFRGQSLHSIQEPGVENPYQQVIKIMGKTLAPFATSTGIPVYGFGDSTTGDWSVFALNGPEVEECSDLDEVLRVYNEVTPQVDLSGPTNFAPLIYKALSLCEKNQDYHILVIIADGQVTNERATRKAIVNACQFPLSIIVVGVGDGPWDMMKVFDESLPKRPWDNFHFVEFHDIINERSQSEAAELDFAIHSLLEVPDQYEKIKQMGLLPNSKKTPMHSKPSTTTTTPLLEQDHV